MRLPLLLLFLLSLPLSAQNAAYRSYINRYAPWAVEQMKEHGIPASITLAQGLLESNAGQSELARKANNHFGIKTGGTWRGPYVLKDDDRRGEKFRKYRSARESYEDHSQFLRTRPRYASLFRLKKTDYEGWARGLKKAGYATNPRYANLLIDLIERYDLAQYDHHLSRSERKRLEAARKEEVVKTEAHEASLRVGKQNGQYFVTARPGDTFKKIAREMHASAGKLRSYNDLPRGAEPAPGDRVYLGKKAKGLMPGEGPGTHCLQAGESLYTVSQRYGIRLKEVVKMNKDFVPEAGARVRLR